MDISFVLIGPEHEQLDLVADTIRYKFPDSEIILSTCNPYEQPERVGANKYLVNTDPGELPNGNLKNVNRNIVNSVEGIKAASNSLVCRLRNDLILSNINFEQLLNESLYKRTYSKYLIFKHNIICNDLYCVNPIGPYKLAYHFGDWFCLGHKEDLLTLFDTPLLTPDECTLPDGKNKYRCEQVFLARLFRKFGAKEIQFDTDLDDQIISDHFMYFLNNFIVCPTYLNMHSVKYSIPRESGYPLMIDRAFYEFLLGKLPHD